MITHPRRVAVRQIDGSYYTREPDIHDRKARREVDRLYEQFADERRSR